MQVLNFSHPLSAEQLTLISELIEGPISKVTEVKVQLSNDQAFGPQISALVDQCGLTPHQWQHTPLLVNLPGLSSAAALIIAEIHGRAGYFPDCLRTAPVGSPPKFEPREILRLSAVRELAREKR